MLEGAVIRAARWVPELSSFVYRTSTKSMPFESVAVVFIVNGKPDSFTRELFCGVWSVIAGGVLSGLITKVR